MYKKIIFFVFWFLLLLIGPYTILKNTNISLISTNQTLLINLLQRIVGLIAFTLLFVQIIVGSNMGRLTQKLGSWIYSFHIFEGVLIYLLIFSHPFLFTLFNYKIKGAIDPFYVYTQVCLICKNSLEVFYTLGRVSFWLLTITVLAGWFRTLPFLRFNWRKLHILNYLVFYLVATHAWFIGTDVKAAPFFWFYWTAIVLITVQCLYRISRGRVS